MKGETVKHKLFAFVAALMVSTQALSAGIDDGTEPLRTPTHLPEVRWVVIESNGQRNTQTSSEPMDCSRFIVSQREVASFLRRSGAVSGRDYMEILNWTPCYATGKVGFVDGRTARWFIRLGHSGWVAPDNAEHRIYLYCPECRLAGQRLP